MKVFKWTVIPVLSTLVLVFITGCAHKQAYKKALEFEKTGQYAAAAEQHLNALDKKPEYADAKSHLTLIAPKAYNELLTRGTQYEAANEWVNAVHNWEQLDRLLNRFQQHGVSLTTINIQQQLVHARQTGTSYHYQLGSQYLQTRQYQEAISQYEDVLAIDQNYLDSRDKLWEAYVRLGEQNMNRGIFDVAIQNYQEALKYTTDKQTTQSMMAEAYYRWGEKLMAEDHYRDATEKFELVLQLDPNFRDAGKRREEAYARALQRVAILPFKNSSGKGPQYGDILADNILNSCIKANLKYATFIDRANLNLILEEHKLAMSGVVDPQKTVEMGKLEGIHYLVTGTISQISQQSTPLSSAESFYEKSYTEKDSSGLNITKTKKINYREYQSSNSVQITASYQVVEVETGRYVSGDSYSEQIVDEAKWVQYTGNINDLPSDKREGVNQRKVPRSPEVLLGEGFQKIGDRVSQKIVEYFK